jgi:hypothetical protein
MKSARSLATYNLPIAKFQVRLRAKQGGIYGSGALVRLSQEPCTELVRQLSTMFSAGQ